MSEYNAITNFKVVSTNETTKPTIREFSLAGKATATVDLSTCAINTVIPDVPAENSVMGVAISHAYLPKLNHDAHVGTHMRLSLNETFQDISANDSVEIYMYTDGKGQEHKFNTYYYHLDESGNKVYVTGDRSTIEVRADGSFWNTDIDGSVLQVTPEYRSATGYKLVPKQEKYKNIEYLERRSKEEKNVEDQAKNYEAIFDDYVKVNVNRESIGNTIYEIVESDGLSGNYDTIEKFDSFMAVFDEDPNVLLLSKSDAVNLKSMFLQASSLALQANSYNQQQKVYDYSRIATNHSVNTWENTNTAYKYPSQNTYEYDEDGNVITTTTRMYINDTAQANYDTTYQNSLKQQLGLMAVDGVTLDLFNMQKQVAVGLESNTEKQAEHNQEQVNLLLQKGRDNVTIIKNYFVDYWSLVNELEYIRKQMPEDFVSDGTYVRGFNKDGELVTIFDNYDNQAVIEYVKYAEEKNGYRIAKMYDQDGKTVSFHYNEKGLLESIFDAKGKRISFKYDDDGKLTEQTNGVEKYAFTYDDSIGILKCIYEVNVGKISELLFNEQGRITNISTYSSQSITDNCCCEKWKFTYDAENKSVLLQDELTVYREFFKFNSEYNLVKYMFEEHGVVTKAIDITPGRYWNGTTYNAPNYTHVQYAHEDLLYQKSIEDFTYDGYAEYYSTTYFNQFELPESEEKGRKTIDGTNNYIEEIVYYEYDEKQQKTKERRKLIEKIGSTTTTRYLTTDYSYDSEGRKIKTESYEEGKEDEYGKEIQVTVYDEKGRAKTSYTYNTLNSTDKFYSEEEYHDDGSIKAEYDESGEHKTEYSYDKDKNLREKKKPNGSKIGVGYDESGRITSITQSTCDGYENSTQRKYKEGEVVELDCGNTKVNYSYDGKRRVTQVKVNDEDYMTYVYSDNVLYSPTQMSDKVTATNAKGEVQKSIFDRTGKLLEKSFDDTVLFKNEYDVKGRPVKCTDMPNDSAKKVEETTSYVGNSDRVATFTRGNYTETYAYDGYGALSSKTDTNSGIAYGFSYKNNSAHDLDTITVTNEFRTLTVEPKMDVHKRNVGKVVKLGNTEIANEVITYKKVGDHATMRPVSASYKNVLGADHVLSGIVFMQNEKITYSYDDMCNIKEIRKNGVLTTRYTYDKLCRLIREDNKALDKTFIFEYDNNGNRLVKREYAFSLNAIDDLQTVLPSLTVNYIYDGDRLVYAGNKKTEYDVMGTPSTQYLGNFTTFERGLLKSYNYATSTYDGRGRLTGYSGYGKNYTITYDSQGRIVERSDGLKFFYDDKGVAGVIHNGTIYTYRRDVQGNVSAIYDETGATVARYVYDAWGNHEVRNNDGDGVISDTAHIGHLNPFRYRSYYYHSDYGLYWLKTRFYDPDTGRFISPDDLSYLDPDSVNGLNLYAYCGNNPVMYSDPSGHFIIAAILIAGAIVGATVAGIDAYNHGQRGWELVGSILLGATIGVGAAGLGISAGVAIAVASAKSISIMVLGMEAVKTFSIGLLSYTILPAIVGPLIGVAFPMIDFNTPSSPSGYLPSNDPTYPNY